MGAINCLVWIQLNDIANIGRCNFPLVVAYRPWFSKRRILSYLGVLSVGMERRPAAYNTEYVQVTYLSRRSSVNAMHSVHIQAYDRDWGLHHHVHQVISWLSPEVNVNTYFITVDSCFSRHCTISPSISKSYWNIRRSTLVSRIFDVFRHTLND